MFNKYIENKKEEIITNLQKLIQIPSIYEKSDIPSTPFGKNVNDALNFMLNLGKAMGFRTKNIDGYCGYIEFGEGEDLVGIIGHLDVVPTDEGWTYPPFSGTIFDNKIYGRGAIDDKGPVIASLYAMKSIFDTCKIHKRVRLILGLDEEKSWKCINYYKNHEEKPTIGFSPDADFPCIYAEKSIFSSCISLDYNKYNKENIYIEEINCNNNPLNVVPKFCSVILKINNDKISIDKLIVDVKNIINNHNFEIDIYKQNYSSLKLTSHGVGAHSAHPELGVNAISRLIVVLYELFKLYSINIPLFDFFNSYIYTQYNGENLKIDFSDESGKLTLNVGNFSLENSELKIKLNMRIPIHTQIEKIENSFTNILSDFDDVKYKEIARKDSLFVPKDSFLVKTLSNIFNEMNNSFIEPIAIGGATYARAFDNCVSFGANMPGNKDMCHQTDEFISIDNLMFACKVYAKAIYKLGN